MKNTYIIKLILILFILSPTICLSDEKNYTYELEFGNPSAKKILQIGGNGDLNITGYEGKKVLISAEENIFEEDEENNAKTKGLKKLGGGGFNIINDKEENCIVISRSIIGKKIGLNLRVPNDIILRLGGGGSSKPPELKRQAEKHGKDNEENSTENDFLTQIAPISNAFIQPGGNGIIAGNITIKNLAGTVEINTVQGDIVVENIKGEVTASSVQGNLKIAFNKVGKDNALYFSTVNGEIDITLPKKTAADIMAKTLNGNVYSGFDGEIITENVVKDQADTTVMENIVNTFFHPNYITTKINGGGQEVYLSTINGNIYIRKGE